MKVLLTWQATPEEVQLIRRHVPEDVELVMTPVRPYRRRFECDVADMMELAKDVDVIMGWAEIPGEVLECAKNLKFISWLHAGCDQLDFPTLRALGIKVSNVSGGTLKVAVAEQAFAFVLGLARRLMENHRDLAEAKWVPEWEPQYMSVGLMGKTMVIVGLGSIGEEIAKRAKAFEMRVVGVDRVERAGSSADEVVPPEELLNALSQADFVVLAVPLTPETRHLISEDELRAMRSGAYLINMCRGDVVHEGPLARALSEGWIAGFASDVWWDYPDAMPPSYHFAVPSRLGVHRMTNVLGSGDKAFNIPRFKDGMIGMGAESVGAFVRGEVPPRLVDLDLGY